MRARPAGSTSSSDRAADLDEAPPGTTTNAEAESESRRMGAAALMQHEWQPAGEALPAEAAPAWDPAVFSEPARTAPADAGDAAAMDEEVGPGADADGAALPNAGDAATNDPAPAHARTNGFAEGHGTGMLCSTRCWLLADSAIQRPATSRCAIDLLSIATGAGNAEEHALTKREPDMIVPDEEQAAKRTKVL